MFFFNKDLQRLKKGTSNAESVTLSFWVKSTITGTYIIQLYDSDNTRHISKSYTVSSSNTWEFKTLTFAGDTTGAFGDDNALSLQVYWWLVAGSTYTSGTLATSWASFTAANAAVGQVNAVNSASNNFYLTGVQLEIGETATPFEHEEIGTTLLKCQRYYMQWGPLTSGGFFRHFAPAYTSNSYTSGNQSFPVEMRAVPTVAVSAITYQNATSWGTGSNDKNQVNTYSQSTGTSTISGAYVANNGTDYAYASAEL